MYALAGHISRMIHTAVSTAIETPSTPAKIDEPTKRYGVTTKIAQERHNPVANNATKTSINAAKTQAARHRDSTPTTKITAAYGRQDRDRQRAQGTFPNTTPAQPQYSPVVSTTTAVAFAAKTKTARCKLQTPLRSRVTQCQGSTA